MVMYSFFWGPYMWEILHSITFNENISEKEKRKFIESMILILPCKVCKMHFCKLYDKYKYRPIKSSKITHMIHNSVNVFLNKDKISYSQAKLIWSHNNISHDSIKIILYCLGIEFDNNVEQFIKELTKYIRGLHILNTHNKYKFFNSVHKFDNYVGNINDIKTFYLSKRV